MRCSFSRIGSPDLDGELCGRFQGEDSKGVSELYHLRSGETLIVWKLDRLGRSMSHLIDAVHELDQRGIGFRSSTEGIDTTTSGCTLVLHLFGALARFERDLIRERIRAGLTLLLLCVDEKAAARLPSPPKNWHGRKC